MAITDPTTFPAAADHTVTTTPSPLPDIPAGPTGILVTAHPGNTVTIRVGDSAVTASQGQPFVKKASFTFATNNAKHLYAVAESGSGVLCVSAV